MEKTCGDAEYTTELISDNAAGWTALVLHKRRKDTTIPAARVVFWDAAGQFYLEASVEVPLAIVEELIVEAKSKIKVR